MKSLRRLAAIVALLVVPGGVYVLREATMTTNYATAPDSRLYVVVEASRNRSEPSHSLRELAVGHLTFCHLEVRADLAGPVEAVAGHPRRFAVVLAPSLDSSDRKQFKGCIEDWVLDHHRMHVISMEDER